MGNIPAGLSRLHGWYSKNARALPWRAKRPDPYRVMVSEFILQQTRMEQGLPYYKRFLERFPTIRALAKAPLDDVLKVWEGCGYYARARNLHKAAKKIMREFGGRGPSDYDALISLPGVGPYMAAAISSIAYEKPNAVLDGNAIRVIARVDAYPHAIDLPRARKELKERAQKWLDASLPSVRPSVHNQAMMELGALVCTPKSPKCGICPLRADCIAYASGRMEEFPRKKRKMARPLIHASVGMLVSGEKVLIARRKEDDFLGGLWEFPGGKVEAGESPEKALRREMEEEVGLRVKVVRHAMDARAEFTHRIVILHVYLCKLGPTPKAPDARAIGCQAVRWVKISALRKFAFPRANQEMIDWLEKRFVRKRSLS